MFASVKNYLSETMKDTDNAFSSKRLVMIAGGICLFCGFWAGLIWSLHAPDNIVDAIKWMTGGATGGVAAEQLRNIGQGKKDD